MSRIVIGVGGGIAAYKVCSVIRHFTEAGHDVHVIPTSAALNFVGAATFEALSGRPIATDVFSDIDQVAHVRIGREADLVIVAPATADLMARAASGRADDLLTATLLTASCPVMYVPAMHTEMWRHPATARNVATLRRFGATVITPASGRLTGADSGEGRLPDPQEIALLGDTLLERPDAFPYDLSGVRLLVSAGGTREPLDPVRYLGNRSSGKQGFALARAAAQRGAEVTLIVGATSGLIQPASVELIRIRTAEELALQLHGLAPTADAVIMAAAVADFRPAVVSGAKIKKTGGDPEALTLATNPDILHDLVTARSAGDLSRDLLIVGFAAETGDENGGVLDHGRAKLLRKGCDLLVVNAVGDGKAFGTDDNTGWILGTHGEETALPLGSKTLMASRILDVMSRLLPDGSSQKNAHPPASSTLTVVDRDERKR